MNSSQDTNIFLVDFGTLFLDSRVSIASKLVFVVGVALYLLLPIDVVPDFLLPFGIVDDGGVLLSAMLIFVRNARQQLENKVSMSDEGSPKYDSEKFMLIPANPNRWGWTQIIQGCFMLTGLLVLLVFVGITVTLLSGVWTMNGVLASIGDFFGQPTTAEVVPSRTIVTSLQPLGQLVSVSVEVAQADINVSVNTGGINLCGHSANHVAQGVIEAGVDITHVGEENIAYDEASNSYTLTLPRPSITSCRIEYIRQYERSGANVACVVDWDAIRLLAQYEAMKLFAADTIEAGILSRAERETTLLMQSFVNALTGSEVNVEYAQADAETILPPSCQPQLPRGWSFDNTLNTWVKIE